jgi:hypothetical protein
LLGFFGGTLAKHWLDRRTERKRRYADAVSLATALHAEISAIRAKAGQLFGLIGQGSGAPSGVIEAGRALGLGIPKATVFEANANLLGLLPPDVCRAVVDFYGIRAAAEDVLSAADPLQRQVLLDGLCRRPIRLRSP